MLKSELYVSATQIQGWCDRKVARVVHAVISESDESLREVLVNATINGGIFKNFMPLPFTEDSPDGQRLMARWEEVKRTHSGSNIAETFVWKFWRPLPDSIAAHLVHDVTGEDMILPAEAQARAYAVAGALLH